MSLYFNCDKCEKHIEFGCEEDHDCEYGTVNNREIHELKSKYQKLLQDHEWLKKGCDHFEIRTYELSFKYNSLLEVSGRLIEALEFYADRSNFETENIGIGFQDKYVSIELEKETLNDRELGTYAREALAQYKKDVGND